MVVVNHKDIQRRFRSLSPFLDERMRRLVAAAESAAIGYGGVSAVARVTGVRLFSFISQNWRGKPLTSHEIIINLIAATTTTTGLAVKSKLDSNIYPAGVKVSDQQMAQLKLRRDRFHGDWNYKLLPES